LNKLSSLNVRDLTVSIGNKRILQNINLKLDSGEKNLIFGPNGSGKSTLLKTIMGVPSSGFVTGSIIYGGVDVIGMSVYERSKLGFALAFQQPPGIRGVKLSQLLKLCLGKKRDDDFSSDEVDTIERFELSDMLDRDVNVEFSGGERKRAEMLQILFMRPRLLLLDEPDSGVDVDSLRLLSVELDNYLKTSKASSLIITHKGDILDYIEAEKACVIIDGMNYCFPDPKRVYEEIRQGGYEHCLTCDYRIMEEKS